MSPLHADGFPEILEASGPCRWNHKGQSNH
jgi:hypothetical protein